MTPKEFKELREQLNFNQTQLAKEWGVTDRTVRRWEAGHAPVSPLASYALRLMVKTMSKA